MRIRTLRRSVGIPHLFYVEEGTNPGGDRDPPNIPKTPLCEGEREWDTVGGGAERRRERDREGRREREEERGKETRRARVGD